MLGFVQPATPVVRDAPPRGERWLHEVKFDGWRVQMHKEGRAVRLLTRSGYDATRRFRELARVLADMPAGSCVIDGEVVACDSYGVPDFLALHFQNARSAVVVVWAFDIIYLDGRDLRDLPLIRRQALLSRLVYRTGNNQLRLSETFDDGAKLLAAAEEFGLEGVVSKRR